jgi:hypothetical protein
MVRFAAESSASLAVPEHLGDQSQVRSTKVRPPGLPLVLVVASFVVSRVAFSIAGLGYSYAGLRANTAWQLLDIRLLQTQLLSSVWHLQSQPPLYNLISGIFLKLPTGFANVLIVGIWTLLGLVVVIVGYLLLVDLRIPAFIAAAIVVVFVVCAPAYWQYETSYSYSYPTMALLTVGFWLLLRFLRSDKALLGVSACGCFAVVVFVNSHYQIVWLLLLIASLCLTLRSRWRSICTIAAIPLLLVFSLYVKDYAMFGTLTTSSWGGMNLARPTLVKVPHSELKRLVNDKTLTPTALVQDWSSPDAYRSVAGPLPKTGVPALDEVYKSGGDAINFNNLIFVKVSDQYLHDDVALILAKPSVYMNSLVVAGELWITPPEQAYFWTPRWAVVGTYNTFYDRYVLTQPNLDGVSAYTALFTSGKIPLDQLSYTDLLIDALAFLGLPVVWIRMRREDPATAAFVAAMWLTLVYSFVVTSLLELGENDRFSFEMGPLPLIGAALVVGNALRALAATWRSGVNDRGEGKSSLILPAASDDD